MAQQQQQQQVQVQQVTDEWEAAKYAKPAQPDEQNQDEPKQEDGPAGQGMDLKPWWLPSEADDGWDDPLPGIVELRPDYSAELPLWGDGFGNIAWQFTKFSPQLLDRLAAWQHDFEAGYHREDGWQSAELRERWASDARSLTAAVRPELGTRSKLIADLWPITDNDESDRRSQG